MSTSVAWWFLLALAVFWVVGAYNRLVRLRAKCFETFVVFRRHMLKYAQLISGHGTQASLKESVVLWVTLQCDLKNLERLIQESAGTAWGDSHMSSLNALGNSITATWGLLRSSPPDLAGPVLPEALLREWDENSMGIKVAIDRFNENAAEYNAAVTQFPARMIASFFSLQLVRKLSMFNEA